MKNKASIVVVGGGIIGTAIAYNLARAGWKDVVLLEKGHLAGGSTGRCAAGVREQWGTEMNCRLAQASIDQFETLSEDLQYENGIEFKQKGYLILAYTEKEWDQFKKNVVLQNSLGIPSRLVTPDEAREIVPTLNTRGLLGASFCPEDGHANPFHATWAYALAAQRLGVEVCCSTEVVGVTVVGGAVRGVVTDKGPIEAEIVVNAAGPYAQVVAAMAGIDAPNYAERHQILVTEPVDPIQGPMVMSFSRRIYCQQTPHGSFIMGMGDPNEPKGFDIGHSWQFLEEVASVATDIQPALRNLRVVRQWSGLYDMTPDAQPVIGKIEGIEGFYMAAGYSGHGFMLGPVTGTLMAEIISGKPTSIDISRLDLGRFKRGDLVREPSVV